MLPKLDKRTGLDDTICGRPAADSRIDRCGDHLIAYTTGSDQRPFGGCAPGLDIQRRKSRREKRLNRDTESACQRNCSINPWQVASRLRSTYQLATDSGSISQLTLRQPGGFAISPQIRHARNLACPPTYWLRFRQTRLANACWVAATYGPPNLME